MEGLTKGILNKAKENEFFRHVLDSAEHTQIVVMSIPPGGEIGTETHEGIDQVLLLTKGRGKVILNGEEADYQEGDIVLVRAGTEHNFINTGDEPLKIVTTYSPPHHPAGTIHKTKDEADQAGY